MLDMNSEMLNELLMNYKIHRYWFDWEVCNSYQSVWFDIFNSEECHWEMIEVISEAYQF